MSTIERALNKTKKTAKQDSASAEIKEGSIQGSTDTKALEASNPTTSKAHKGKDNSRYLKLNLDERYFVTDSTTRSLLSEEFRAIKRKVLSNAFGPLSKTLSNSNIIMVTSANPGEGKTYTAVNLALSIALEQDKTVLLVDADVLRPNVMRTLGVDYDNGLMEYLIGDVSDIADVMYQTNVEKLRIIPAGKSHHLSTELLASEKMLETVVEFANRYSDRVVIFDTPPLLGVNETAIMTNLAGQAVVVIAEGQTKLTNIESAIEQLNPTMAKGFVINKSRQNQGQSGYGYGYGYYASGPNTRG
ncbi:XrtA-associated tyrosine autokinase [Alteromonadaceae bacterium BrNp21-10]|nr:XrtA-associated tyrosine autokinase [Alteromonadaceae bacterium BrNp21-10]